MIILKPHITYVPCFILNLSGCANGSLKYPWSRVPLRYLLNDIISLAEPRNKFAFVPRALRKSLKQYHTRDLYTFKTITNTRATKPNYT